jgi:hypothetical protein
MRKKIMGPAAVSTSRPGEEDWLDIESLARVEVSSEDSSHPIEAALIPGAGSGWRAAGPGEQVIRLLFDEPQRLRRILLVFEEWEAARTQELVLRWLGNSGYREVVRQQYNFSSPSTVREVEDYSVDLVGVAALELRIVPDLGGSDARASLAMMRLG